MHTKQRLYEAQVLVNGRPVTEVHHNDRLYIEGRRNSEFQLRFSNWTWHRALVVPSVDGMNVINREACGIESPGYVVGAHSSVTIPGWTLDNSAIAKFVFKPQGARPGRGQTFAEAMGEGQNQGVIGFMVFEELFEPLIIRHVYTPNPWRSCSPWGDPVIGSTYTANVVSPTRTFGDSSPASQEPQDGPTHDSYCVASTSACADVAPAAGDEGAPGKLRSEEASLGTGFGKEATFNTTEVPFNRKTTHPSEVIAFYYDTIGNLKRQGIPVDLFKPTRKQSSGANPFPASPGVVKDARIPSWYKRR